ncbi:CBS domain-containing protein [Falsiroseomonas oryzae]|uniref:CBS domain-containing protein n=1 Tax=Falsiroseomonas oryzae TaxID=2766473 RepID=UPI0022EB193C|nr:CBS domain-containing protein [Roseomonas sp. MO-31]
MAILRARDLMGTTVVTLPPDTPVRTIARLFADRGISAVAITDEAGALAGIVTESDLIRRLANEDDRPLAGWLVRLFDNPAAKADRYARSHGARARDVMSGNVVTVGPEETAAHVARLMEERRIRRVLVTEGGRLLGMVTRADLVRALLGPEEPAAHAATDETIRLELLRAMEREPWVDTTFIGVDVHDGVAAFHGFIGTPAVRQALRVLAENVPGVRRVEDNTRPFPRNMEV